YIVFFLLHYFCFVLRGRRQRLREVVLCALVSSAILLSWFGWSFARYGVRTTLASNTTITSTGQYSAAGNVKKVLSATLFTLLPRVQSDSVPEIDRQPSALGKLRDR